MIAVTDGSVETMESDESIVESLAAGDSSALAALYDRYGRIAYYVAYRVLGDSAAAEDVVQDVFVSVWKHAASFDPHRGRVRTWLLTSVRHRCIDILRGFLTSPLQELKEDTCIGATTDEFWDSLSSRIDAEEVRRALVTLPEDQRMMIHLNYFRGMTHPQIAEHLRIPLGTVKGRLRLAMHKLRKSFLVVDEVAVGA